MSVSGKCRNANRTVPELLFDSLDRVERLPRVGALVIAVLDDQVAGRRAADVIDVLIQRCQGQLAVVRRCVESHGPPPGGGGQLGWSGSLEADRLADEDDVDAAGQFLVDLQDLPHLVASWILECARSYWPSR